MAPALGTTEATAVKAEDAELQIVASTTNTLAKPKEENEEPCIA